MLDIERLKHSDRKILSLIDIPLWNKAKWSGTAFMTASPSVIEPPVLVLLFENLDPAKAIFSTWRKDLGKEDREDRLRVCVLTGIDKDNPAAYRVVLSENLRFNPAG